MALNDLNLVLAPNEKILFILSFHIRRDLIDQKTISRYCLFKSNAPKNNKNLERKERKMKKQNLSGFSILSKCAEGSLFFRLNRLLLALNSMTQFIISIKESNGEAGYLPS
jgi:hypothetical protein